MWWLGWEREEFGDWGVSLGERSGIEPFLGVRGGGGEETENIK